ncbi:MAG: hypothetical protein JW915_11165 [Chitinispirillaceae bacterium]|nr:hypothetical protein [Chitinispirillaceae bacterium]
MLQIHLPIFHVGATDINDHFAFEMRDQRVTYFYGDHPVFTHHKDDLRSLVLKKNLSRQLPSTRANPR